jgi:hypothetical protein
MDPVQEQFDAYNAGDLERFQACYHPDAVVEDNAGARLMDGAAAATAEVLGIDSHDLGDYRLEASLAGEQ